MEHSITPIEADLPSVLLKEWNDKGFIMERLVSKYHAMDPTHIRVQTMPDGYEGVFHRGELPPGTNLYEAMVMVLTPKRVYVCIETDEDPSQDGAHHSFHDLQEFLEDFNEGMGTDYSTMEEFNKGEEYRTIYTATS